MREYITKSGDMWDLIAYEQLGSSRYTGELLDANRDKLEHFIFSAGVKLKIPDTDTAVNRSLLPPWRR